MTVVKRRDPVSFPDAVVRIASDQGWSWAAASLVPRRSESLLRKAADPDHDFCLSLEQALQLDCAYAAATGEPPPFLTVYQTRFDREASAPLHEGAEPLRRAADVVATIGRLTAEVAASVDRGHINGANVHQIDGEIARAHQVLEKLHLDVQALAKRPKK